MVRTERARLLTLTRAGCLTYRYSPPARVSVARRESRDWLGTKPGPPCSVNPTGWCRPKPSSPERRGTASVCTTRRRACLPFAVSYTPREQERPRAASYRAGKAFPDPTTLDCGVWSSQDPPATPNAACPASSADATSSPTAPIACVLRSTSTTTTTTTTPSRQQSPQLLLHARSFRPPSTSLSMADPFAPRTMKRRNVKGLALTPAAPKPPPTAENAWGASNGGGEVMTSRHSSRSASSSTSICGRRTWTLSRNWAPATAAPSARSGTSLRTRSWPARYVRPRWRFGRVSRGCPGEGRQLF